MIQVADEATGETLYALRTVGDRHRPGVFQAGDRYTMYVGEPGTERVETLTGLEPTGDPGAERVVTFR